MLWANESLGILVGHHHRSGLGLRRLGGCINCHHLVMAPAFCDPLFLSFPKTEVASYMPLVMSMKKSRDLFT